MTIRLGVILAPLDLVKTLTHRRPYNVIPDLIGDLLHTQKYEVENLLLNQSGMSENLVEAVVSDIDKLRYPVEPGMTIRLGVTFEPGMMIRRGVILESGMTVGGRSSGRA